MSRGPGRIERAIASAFAAEPDNAFTIGDLCIRVYPEIARGFALPEKKHRVAVLRAAKKVAAQHPNGELWESETRGGELTFFHRYNVMSYAMARLKSGRFGSRYHGPRPPHYDDETRLRKRLAPGGDFHESVIPGGVWWRHVELRIAERDGDTKKIAKLQAEHEAARAEIFARLGAWL